MLFADSKRDINSKNVIMAFTIRNLSDSFKTERLVYPNSQIFIAQRVRMMSIQNKYFMLIKNL